MTAPPTEPDPTGDERAGEVPAGVDPDATTHRGVRWRRDADGGLAWFNDGLGRWVRWRPGADAPPRPPEWEADRPPPPREARAGWSSPYRWVPVAVAAVIVGVGILLTRPGSNQTAAESKAAAKLLDACLHQTGVVKGLPQFDLTPVACTSPLATVKVVAVVASTPGSPGCPDGIAYISLQYAGVRYPHLECLRPVAAPGSTGSDG